MTNLRRDLSSCGWYRATHTTMPHCHAVSLLEPMRPIQTHKRQTSDQNGRAPLVRTSREPTRTHLRIDSRRKFLRVSSRLMPLVMRVAMAHRRRIATRPCSTPSARDALVPCRMHRFHTITIRRFAYTIRPPTRSHRAPDSVPSKSCSVAVAKSCRVSIDAFIRLLVVWISVLASGLTRFRRTNPRKQVASPAKIHSTCRAPEKRGAFESFSPCKSHANWRRFSGHW